jgi:hypothetical protein
MPPSTVSVNGPFQNQTDSALSVVIISSTTDSMFWIDGMMKVIIAGTIHFDHISGEQRENGRHIVIDGLGGTEIRAGVVALPLGPRREARNRSKGKPPWFSCCDDTCQAFPVTAMFWVSVEFASRVSIGIKIAEDTVKEWAVIHRAAAAIVEYCLFHPSHDVLNDRRDWPGVHQLATVGQCTNTVLSDPCRGSSFLDGSSRSGDNGILSELDLIAQTLNWCLMLFVFRKQIISVPINAGKENVKGQSFHSCLQRRLWW